MPVLRQTCNPAIHLPFNACLDIIPQEQETSHQRKYAFAGSLIEYVRHLEEKVKKLESHLISTASDESSLVFQIERPQKQTAKVMSTLPTKSDKAVSDF